jgi:hypothetical protein
MELTLKDLNIILEICFKTKSDQNATQTQANHQELHLYIRNSTKHFQPREQGLNIINLWFSSSHSFYHSIN